MGRINSLFCTLDKLVSHDIMTSFEVMSFVEASSLNLILYETVMQLGMVAVPWYTKSWQSTVTNGVISRVRQAGILE